MVKHLHQSVAKESLEFLSALRRYNYVTPTSYLEVLSTYRNVLNMKRLEVGTLKNRLQVTIRVSYTVPRRKAYYVVSGRAGLCRLSVRTVVGRGGCGTVSAMRFSFFHFSVYLFIYFCCFVCALVFYPSSCCSFFCVPFFFFRVYT